MAAPLFPKVNTIDVVAEFKQWSAGNPYDAADTFAKLVSIGKFGVDLINIFSDDTFIPPDLFCRQVNGWGCFYVVRPGRNGDADVTALLVAQLPQGTIAPLEQEALRRRGILGV